MDRSPTAGNGQTFGNTETLFLLGGVALVLMGAGLLLSTETAKKYMGGLSVGDLVQAAVPDVDRYLKLRSM
jgi:hypothetical protein